MSCWWVLVFLLVIMVLLRATTRRSDESAQYVAEAFEALNPVEIEEVSDEYLGQKEDEIMLVATPADDSEVEGFATYSGAHNANRRFWPRHYYANVANWPVGLFSRHYQWSPGFYTSGWKYALRPGSRGYWPRSTWVRNNGSYYFLNNREY